MLRDYDLGFQGFRGLGFGVSRGSGFRGCAVSGV